MNPAERLVVVVRVTEHCNLSCRFCAYDKTLSRRRVSADPEMVLALARRLAVHAREHQPVLLSLLGGEPLLWSPLSWLEPELRALGILLSVTTNGTALGSARVRERLREHYAEVTISVDGLGAVHDGLRGSPGGFEALRRDVRALASARRKGRPLLRVNTVLMADNVETFADLCLELATWGIDEITFNQLGGADRPEFYAAHRLRESAIEAFGRSLPALRAALAERSVRLRGNATYVERFMASARGRALPVLDCHPGERFLFGTEDGVLAPCSYTLKEYGVALAEAELGVLPSRFRARRELRRASACQDCPSTQVFEKFVE